MKTQSILFEVSKTIIPGDGLTIEEYLSTKGKIIALLSSSKTRIPGTAGVLGTPMLVFADGFSINAFWAESSATPVPSTERSIQTLVSVTSSNAKYFTFFFFFF